MSDHETTGKVIDLMVALKAALQKPVDPIPGPGGVVGEGRRRGERTGPQDRKPKERRKSKRGNDGA